MDKKSLMKDIGYKLSKIRKSFKFNPGKWPDASA